MGGVTVIVVGSGFRCPCCSISCGRFRLRLTVDALVLTHRESVGVIHAGLQQTDIQCAIGVLLGPVNNAGL